MVARKSQIRPFHEKHMLSDQRGRDDVVPTCLQRYCPKGNMVPYMRRRSRPTSIVTSKVTSETNTAMMVFFVSSEFGTPQALCAGTHVA